MTPLHLLVHQAREAASNLGRRGTACAPDAVLRGPAYRRRRSLIENLRTAVQAVSALVVLWMGIQFAAWAHALEQGRIAGTRPPGVEGFLPISALISLRHLFLTGEISRVHPAGLALLVLILANGLLLKRSFCSWICPVGTISESLESASRFTFRRRISLPRALDIPLRSLKYLLLAFFAYAIFVKMAPAEVDRFINSPYNKVADLKMLRFFAHPAPLTLKVLLVLVVASFAVPYAWCRYLCPYGALLGVLSLLSPVRIKRHADACIDCGLCTKACPSRLQVDRADRVRSDECFGCLSCVAACPVPAALRLETPGRRGRIVRPLVFAALVAGLFFGGIGIAKLAGVWKTGITGQEYLRRAQEMNGPTYTHARGQVPDYGPAD